MYFVANLLLGERPKNSKVSRSDKERNRQHKPGFSLLGEPLPLAKNLLISLNQEKHPQQTPSFHQIHIPPSLSNNFQLQPLVIAPVYTIFILTSYYLSQCVLGHHPHPKKPHPLYSPSPIFNLQTVQTLPPFRKSPYILFFP